MWHSDRFIGGRPISLTFYRRNRPFGSWVLLGRNGEWLFSSITYSIDDLRIMFIVICDCMCNK